jgi:hypothetical protein
MKIQLFKNKRGLIHGADPARIGCDVSGTLKIGKVEVNISTSADSVMPLLANGLSGEYRGTYTDLSGQVYELDKVAVREGRIAPPPSTTVELSELRYRVDELEDKVEFLGKIFDTNSLNFLIQ